jgi:hypothetical protein
MGRGGLLDFFGLADFFVLGLIGIRMEIILKSTLKPS